MTYDEIYKRYYDSLINGPRVITPGQPNVADVLWDTANDEGGVLNRADRLMSNREYAYAHNIPRSMVWGDPSFQEELRDFSTEMVKPTAYDLMNADQKLMYSPRPTTTQYDYAQNPLYLNSWQNKNVPDIHRRLDDIRRYFNGGR